jgi:Glycosyltransferase family 10 (fucosyltransferase) C-term/Fucosyltransferase, N-terminal
VKPLILLYDIGWAIKILSVPDESHDAEFTTDLDRLPDAHVVVFHIPSPPDFATLTKLPGQIWVALSLESEVNYPSLSNLEFMRRFDLTMTYRLDSDIPVPYLGPWKAETLLNPASPKTARSPAAYFASNPFDRCGRSEYVRQLMEHVPVDSYGQCWNNCKLPEDNGRDSKLDAIARYKFTLAFENSISRDYVTEKFFDALIAGSVPIYRGAPNIGDFAPGECCYIDASRFRGPRELAEYLLYLDRNETEYQSFLRWKTRPLDPRFLEMMNRFSVDALARLAAKLSLRNGVLESAHVQCDPIHKAVRWLNRIKSGDGGFPD